MVENNTKLILLNNTAEYVNRLIKEHNEIALEFSKWVNSFDIVFPDPTPNGVTYLILNEKSKS